jgi:hypothetical protein
MPEKGIMWADRATAGGQLGVRFSSAHPPREHANHMRPLIWPVIRRRRVYLMNDLCFRLILCVDQYDHRQNIFSDIIHEIVRAACTLHVANSRSRACAGEQSRTPWGQSQARRETVGRAHTISDVLRRETDGITATRATSDRHLNTECPGLNTCVSVHLLHSLPWKDEQRDSCEPPFRIAVSAGRPNRLTFFISPFSCCRLNYSNPEEKMRSTEAAEYVHSVSMSMVVLSHCNLRRMLWNFISSIVCIYDQRR